MDYNKPIALTYPWSIKVPISILAFTATLLVSYNYVEIISIHETLQDHFMHRAMMSSKQFENYYGLMVSFQSFTSIFASLCLGYIADKWGYQAVLIVISILMTSAQLFIEIGLIKLNFKFIILGRILLTPPYGSLGVPMGRVLKKFFGPDNQFPLISALNSACSILGCLLNSLLASNLTSSYGILKASVIPLLLALICTLCLIILTMVDKKYQVAPEDDQIYINKDFPYYRNKIYPQLGLLLALIVQNALIGIFCMIGTKFLNQYWGAKDKYFRHQTNDDYLSGIFWFVILITMILTGAIATRQSVDKINILVTAVLLQTLGFTIILFVNPFISMPVLACGIAVGWAVVYPFFIEKFREDFGIVYGFLTSASAFVMFSLSLVSEKILSHTNSYYYSFLMFLGLQITAALIVIKYKRSQLTEQEIETEILNN